MMVLTSLATVAGGEPDYPIFVDVGEIIGGEAFHFTYWSYNFTGLVFVNLADTVLIINFSHPADSAIYRDNRQIGFLNGGSNTTLLLTIEQGAGTVELRYQGVPDLEVSIEEFTGGDLGVPDGSVLISGTTQEYGGQYQTTYSFDGRHGYNVSLTTDDSVKYVGVVDNSIVVMGNGSADFFLRAATGTGAATLSLLSGEAEQYELQVDRSDYRYGNGTLPVNVNQNITVDDGLITIAVGMAEFDDILSSVTLTQEIPLGLNVTLGYEIEEDYPYLNITRMNGDVVLVLDEYTAEITEEEPPRQAYITARYQVEIRNMYPYFTGYQYQYPGEDYALVQFTIAEVVYDILSVDEDGDGYPTVEFLTHDLTLGFIDNGTNITISEGIPYHLYPHDFGGVLGDDDDSNPSIPNLAADHDMDNLSVRFEVYHSGSDPLSFDSDGDGSSDWLDIFRDSANDTDGDGLADSFELELGTNPLDVDTDDDYFEDGAEYYYWTDRGYNISADIDGGGESFLNDSDSDVGNATAGEFAAAEWYVLQYPLLRWEGNSTEWVNYLELDGIEVLRSFTDPAVWDSDGDGFADGGEAFYWRVQGYDITDSDGDGTLNNMDNDSDNDGLSDGFEIYGFLSWTNITNAGRIIFYNLWENYYLTIMGYAPENITQYFPFNTPPAMPEIDVMNFVDQSLLRPLGMVLPASADTDGDGLSDYDEFYYPDRVPSPNGSISEGGIYEDHPIFFNASLFSLPNPFLNDTDMDGLLDGEEVAWGYLPVFPDTDFDQLPDSIEDENGDGVRDGTETGAKLWDTDGDGMDDGYEVMYGFNPLNSADGLADYDNDGYDFDRNGTVYGDETFTNFEEYLAWTDPYDADTDDDGMNDGFEVYYGLEPRRSYDASYDEDDDGMPFVYGREFFGIPLTNLEEYNLNTDPTDSDTDDDGLPDGWEQHFGLDPLDAIDANGDADGDGLTNAEEYSYETYPTNSDTDGDGMPDKWEIDNSIDNNIQVLYPDARDDEDDDDLSNFEEYQAGTDPNDADTDDDGMPDAYEVAYGLDPNIDDALGDLDGDDHNGDPSHLRRTKNKEEYDFYPNKLKPNDADSDDDTHSDGVDSDPWDADTDEDGVSDSVEDANDSDTYDEGDPRDPSNFNDVDTDDDGLWDGKFTDHPTYGFLWIGEESLGTDPTLADTDGDGLGDFEEYWTHLTDPTDSDSDDDGLSDGEEINTYNTDPLLKDSDEDGFNDYEEINTLGTNANNADSDGDGVPDSVDIEPKYNAELQVRIKEILVLDGDGGADLKTKVQVKGGTYDVTKEHNFDAGSDYSRTSLTHRFDIPDNLNSFPKVSIYIRVFDDDTWPNSDDEYDISTRSEVNYVHVTFNFKTGLWTSDDDGGTSDTNGIGFSKGGGSNEDNAAIWFDIKMREGPTGTSDGDGLSHRAERYWGTEWNDPNSDGDPFGVSDRFEAIYGPQYGFHPAIDEDEDPDDDYDGDYEQDYDEDGIKFKDEFKFGGIPGQKDIFVEVDYMGDPGPLHWGSDEMSDKAIMMVMRPFAKKGIWMHIDIDDEITHDDETTKDEFVGDCPECLDTSDVTTIYGREFTDNRQGIFHYAVFGHDTDMSYVGGYAFGDAIWISDSKYEGSLGGAKEEEQAQAFMHELGHHFDLNADSLYASDSRDSYNYPNDPIDDDLYPSSMRYSAKKGDKGYMDYSSRTGSIQDLWYYDSATSIFTSGYNLPNTDDWGTVKNNLGWVL